MARRKQDGPDLRLLLAKCGQRWSYPFYWESQLLTFNEAMERVEEGGKPSILLGNGFSRAWNNDIFNYHSLLEAADFGGRNRELRDIFDRLGTSDFESAMRALVSARTVLAAYGNQAELVAQIERDEQQLKDSLIEVLSRTHPERPREVDDAHYVAVRTFLAKFEQVFTVNYDLLFYWARNMKLAPAGYRGDDGFREFAIWQGYETKQNAHFLHGALHLFDEGATVRKHTFRSNGDPIIDQVQANLNVGKFPLFVAEPSSDKKLQRIQHNPYLNYCYRQLSIAAGTVFIHGHSIDVNDQHIFDALKRSHVKQFFISIFGDEDSDENLRTKANARTYLECAERTIDFVDAATAPIWNLENVGAAA